MIRVILVVLVFCIPCNVLAQGPQNLTFLKSGVVTDVTEDKALLTDDGDEIVLAGIYMPGTLAMQYLEKEFLGQKISVWQGKKGQKDRYERILGHVVRDDGVWAQATLIKRGLAWVQTSPNTRDLAVRMLLIETIARHENNGLWADVSFQIRTGETVSENLNSFQIVEGEIVDTYVSRNGTIYLNFGEDWKTDFTVAISKSDARLFDPAPDMLTGRRIRVRGWVRDYNGPLIDVTHPEQIELLS